MQTFLPYPSFTKSARALDWRRLGNQRNEASIIIKTLYNQRSGWVHHPAVKMWEGYQDSLILYRDIIILEWMRRGYKNNLKLSLKWMYKFPEHPPWMGNEEFHASHRSNLLRKDPEWYGQFGWTEPNDLPYVWPILH